jgi:hypothetical protein
MKKMLLATMLMLFSLNGFSQIISDISTATILSPFVSASKLIEVVAVSSLMTIQATRMVVQSKGVAGREQLKDELVVLSEEIMAGEVRFVADVRQPGLRELFEEIQSDKEQLQKIQSIVETGSELHQIATVVTMILILD